MKIVIIGAGYVGLVSAACLADLGHIVICIEKDQNKLSALQDRRSTLYEEGLFEIINRSIDDGRLSFTNSIDMVDSCDALFIAVGTPFNQDDGITDTTFLDQAIDSSIHHFHNQDLFLVIKSTVPTGTADKLRTTLPDRVHIISNPEFLKQGHAVYDFMHPDRIVIGVKEIAGNLDTKSIKVMTEIYQPLIDKGIDLQVMNNVSAEIVKYAANGFLASKIAFANEITNLCSLVNANISDVIKGIGSDHRIGHNHLQPGPGFGGSCFPKDSMELERLFMQWGLNDSIVSTVIRSNRDVQQRICKGIAKLASLNNYNKITFLGVTFKSNTDDVRSSPALALISALYDLGYEIRVYDPQGLDNARNSLGPEYSNITWSQNEYEASSDSDIIVITTEWDQFFDLDTEHMYNLCSGKTMVDLRNIYQKAKMQAIGWKYYNLSMIYYVTVHGKEVDEYLDA